MKNLKEEIKKEILSLDLGYKWLMSDYATSQADEDEYEKKGLEEVNEVTDKLLRLFSEYVEGIIGKDEILEPYLTWRKATKKYGGTQEEYSRLQDIVNNYNNLRYEQREKLAELKKSIKNSS